MNSEPRQRQENFFTDATQSVEEDPLIDHSLLYGDALVGEMRAHFKGNAILLILFVLMQLKLETLVIYFILGVLTVELFFSSVCLIIYTVKIIKFNQLKPCPDIQEEERRHRYPNLTNVLSETGFRDGSNLENLVEKQADLIDYLKMHNVELSKRLLTLTSQQVRD
ncbi:transmembrane protein 192 isoform X2 [Chiloscyllium plagiosum]|uniref:transmembrane protein 192 isoform X2 n=1 Tax=Chiloscyllium plagiosum TaxID=36176 RepID=UPI001CB7CEF2|nr:transmembrane protein 192 isoform X2 [Chiloscyllium plagiosum]